MFYRFIILTCLILVLICNHNHAQICEGNLGENIFTDGDFGTGAANILQTDPMIAPGYIYQLNPPPDDGYYTITNNTTNWGSFAVNWANIGDNSPDPNGYMMIVNASFNPGIFYINEVEGLCENTLYVFSADIYNIADGIQPNVSFLLDGLIVYETGDIPVTNEWETYGFTFKTGPDQTSLVLSLQNNAAGGIGNDLALDNISFRACGPQAFILPETVENICEDGEAIQINATITGEPFENQTIQWQESLDGGLTWHNIIGANDPTYEFDQLVGGKYYYRFLLANGPENILNPKCRIVSNEKIINVIPKFYDLIDTLCTGLSFELAGTNYNQSGIYTDSLTSAFGCDSIVTLDLTILEDPQISFDLLVIDPSCFGESNGIIEITAINNASPPYQLGFNNTLTNVVQIDELTSGQYALSVIDRFGCSHSEEVWLFDPPEFIVNLGPDIEIDLGEAVFISPATNQPIGQYQWVSQDTTCNQHCDDLEFTPHNSGSVIFSATSLENNCLDADTLYINVNEIRKVYFPNIIDVSAQGSPNNSYTIFGAEPNVQNIESLKIYDRWGNLVFEKEQIAVNNPSSGWDGRINHQLAEQGVYIYQAEIRFLDNELIEYAGSFLLLR